MKLLVTGAAGFVGHTLASAFAQRGETVYGVDNFCRAGSETNRESLRTAGVKLFHGDLRQASDLEAIGPVDWVIDAAANPSVLAGIDGRGSSRQVVEHNLGGTINLLEYCKTHRAGFILLSTSRVYAIAPLAQLAVEPADNAFRPRAGAALPAGLTADGIAETFSTQAPVSLYGATKLASEALALEYGATFNLPVFINRCGVLAGAGQFGRADQGIFAFWINSYRRRRPLRYIGFGGQGWQVRDCLHPRDLPPVLARQMAAPLLPPDERVANFSGGTASATSLRQLSAWCAARFGEHPVDADLAPRPFDLPWVVLDSAKASRLWQWRPSIPAREIFEEIAVHAEAHPAWLDLSAGA